MSTQFYEERKKELTRSINKYLSEREKIAKAKRPIADKVRELGMRARFEGENKELQQELAAARAEQFIFAGEVRRVRSELQKLRKQWQENEASLNIQEQREDKRSQPSATRVEDY